MSRRRVISTLCIIAAVILLITAAYFAVKIYNYLHELNTETAAFEQLAVEVQSVVEAPKEEDASEALLSKYRELAIENPDMVGWISIDDTVVNYPVMLTVDEPNYYLNHNFKKQISSLGTPYIQEDCSLLTSDNIIIYGHHIRGGRMFAALDQYMEESFYEDHRIIHFDTLYELAEYEIIAVFKTALYQEDVLAYYDFVTAEDEADFNDFVASCKDASLYDTGVDASYGDRLITLSTCEYSAQNGRLVVVAKKISSEGDEDNEKE